MVKCKNCFFKRKKATLNSPPMKEFFLYLMMKCVKTSAAHNANNKLISQRGWESTNPPSLHRT